MGPVHSKAKDAMKAVEGCARNIGEAATHASQALDDLLPRIHTMARHGVYFSAFNSFVATAGVAAQFVQVYYVRRIAGELKEIRQELAVQTGLKAPKKFADQVHKYISMKCETARGPDKHYFFLYHPDNDWHAQFFSMVKSNPLPHNFYGMSDNLDAICVWMHFLRIVISSQGKSGRRAVFHLLMPAYRTFVIKEPLDFAPKLYPLCLHGMTHNTQPFVYLNLPDTDTVLLREAGIGVWKKPWSFGDIFKGIESTRILGEVPDMDYGFSMDNGTRRVSKRRRPHHR